MTERAAESDALLKERMDIWDSGYRAGRADTEEAVLNGMTPPEVDPGSAFWRGAQWAYGEVRKVLAEQRTSSGLTGADG